MLFSQFFPLFGGFHFLFLCCRCYCCCFFFFGLLLLLFVAAFVGGGGGGGGFWGAGGYSAFVVDYRCVLLNLGRTNAS